MQSIFQEEAEMNRAGQYITALNGEAAYKAYHPNPLPPSPGLEMDEELVGLLAKAHHGLGKLDATSELVPNMDLFLGAYVRNGNISQFGSRRCHQLRSCSEFCDRRNEDSPDL